jgi:small redox-active disulfide protein 2
VKIEVYGTGCPKCHATIGNAQKVVKELGLEPHVEVAEVKDIKAISAKGIFLTPGVVIDGVKVSEGRVPSPEEIKKWIKERKQ